MLTGYNLPDLANRFVNWRQQGYWTPHGKVFDIGFTTDSAIQKLKNGTEPIQAGGRHEDENGNGSLMRVLPLILYIRKKSIEERFQITREVSSLTHAHIRSVVSCFIYLEYARLLIEGYNKWDAYTQMQELMDTFADKTIISYRELKVFDRILLHQIHQYYESEIFSSGYVIHSLEASLWCVLTCQSYEETVLKAVNLGGDTDTTAAIAGGLAGIIYGWEQIPEKWQTQLVRKDDIFALSEKLQTHYF